MHTRCARGSLRRIIVGSRGIFGDFLRKKNSRRLGHETAEKSAAGRDSMLDVIVIEVGDEVAQLGKELSHDA